MPRLLVINSLLGIMLLGATSGAAERTTVALTTTVPAAHQQLADSLIALVELGVLADDSLAVVERQQMDLAMQELAFSRSRSADESLQLGKLLTADVLVMLDIRQPDDTSSKPSAMLRIVQAKTAAIRGITVASDVEEASLAEIADQFVRYVSTVIREPQMLTVTVAVAPFESVGRFERLRPLELGIRDLVTERLLQFCGPVAPRQDSRTSSRSESAIEPPNVTRAPATLSRSDRATFQVVQRTNLAQLLREMDLIQSGFVDKDRLPRTLPSREAAFLIKGEIDERQVDGKFTIVVRGELRHAASAKILASFEFECLPTELEKQLTVRVDELAKHLGVAETSRLRTDVGHADNISEADSLKRLALHDLHRFRRRCPIDHGHRAFALTMSSAQRSIPKLVRPDSPLGRALLQKSIDRLETVLFIHPDDAQAAYGLGFCFSIHQPGVYSPERADELLRKAASLQPQSELAALALAFLSELVFDDQDAHVDLLPSRHTRQNVGSQVLVNVGTAADAAAERLWLAFEKTPVAFRDHRWPRILGLYAKLPRTSEQNAALLEKVLPFAEQANSANQHQLAGEVKSLAMRLAAQSSKHPSLNAKAIDSLRRWADGSDMLLADFGRQGLAAISETNGDYLTAAILYEESATKLATATSDQGRHRRDVQRVHAAKNFRLAKEFDRALRLLRSFEPKTPLTSNLIGMHGYEIGMCYEALGESQKALAAYLRAAELCPGIVPNSNLVDRVTALGGVPLRKDRFINVRYVTSINHQRYPISSMATDGQRLFLGTGQAVLAFDPANESFEILSSAIRGVTCLKVRDRALWVGTLASGVWRCDLGSKNWTRFGTDQGLPDSHVESLALHGSDAYIGVGSGASGGLVRIGSNDEIHLFNEPDAPSVAPKQIVITEKRLLARTLEKVFEWSFESKTWMLHPADPNRRPVMAPALFAGESTVWASGYGQELMQWDADAATNQQFQSAWYNIPGNKAGIIATFVAERGDEVWFGGQPWELFTSSGLYCFNLKTCAFQKFSPADGFKSVYVQSISDGLWLKDQLWLATTQGLCTVTRRN